jgi:leucyl-tRNA synthetase
LLTFIADFYCNEKKVIIEIDGEVHNTQIEYDEMRTEILEEMGYKLIRFRNEEVIAKLESVLLKLEQFTSRV